MATLGLLALLVVVAFACRPSFLLWMVASLLTLAACAQ